MTNCNIFQSALEFKFWSSPLKNQVRHGNKVNFAIANIILFAYRSKISNIFLFAEIQILQRMLSYETFLLVQEIFSCKNIPRHGNYKTKFSQFNNQTSAAYGCECFIGEFFWNSKCFIIARSRISIIRTRKIPIFKNFEFSPYLTYGEMVRTETLARSYLNE